MKRRSFSLSVLSLVSTLPATAQRIFALALDGVEAQDRDLQVELTQIPSRPAGTVTLLPIGFTGDPFAVAAVSEEGKMFTQTVSFDVTPPLSPTMAARIEVPLLKRATFSPVQDSFRLDGGTADFGTAIGVLPYSVITVHPDRAWTAKGIRVAAAGEPLTVRTINGGETPIIVTEWLGYSPLDVYMSPALRQLLERRGVNVNELIESASVPNLRQRVLRTTRGVATLRAPDPPLRPELIDELGVVQVTVWSPVPITVLEREG